MKNKLFLLILSLFCFNTKIFSFQGVAAFTNVGISSPRINHYGNPYLDVFNFGYRHNPKSLINVIPDALAYQITSQLDVKADLKTAKTELIKLIDDKNYRINFFSVIWDFPGNKEAWPADRNYNLIFHETVQKWVTDNPPANFNPQFFNFPILMGLFNANGVQPLPGSGLSGPVSFDTLEPKYVNLHPYEEAIERTKKLGRPNGPWFAHELAYSPNNANFHMKNGRDIATFWTTAISPNKKNIIIIFNTLINNDEILNTLEKAKNDSSNNLNQVLNAIEVLAKTMAATGKKEDSQALINTVNIFRGIPDIPEPKIAPKTSALLEELQKAGLMTLEKLKAKTLEQIIKNINEPMDANGTTLLMMATNRKNAPLARALLASGAKKNIKNKTGQTALNFAKGTKDQAIIAMLSPKVPDLIQELQKAGLLEHAKLKGKNPDYIKKHINEPMDANNTTLLMMAAHRKNVPLTKALLQAGANKSAKNIKGSTALDFAKTSNNPILIKLLG